METKQKKKCTVRCTNCRTEATGKSLKDILSEMKCGKDGGPITDSCRSTLRSDGKFLFEVVPCEGTPDLLKEARDKAAKAKKEAEDKALKNAEIVAKKAEKEAEDKALKNGNDTSTAEPPKNGPPATDNNTNSESTE